MKIHYTFYHYEIWIELETTATATVIRDAINDAVTGWEIDYDGGGDLPPSAYITAELEAIGARIRKYCEVEK